jgi:hypothetical protein
VASKWVWWAYSSCCVLTWAEEANKLFQASFIKTLIPLMGLMGPLWPSHLPKPPLIMPPNCRLCFHTRIGWGHIQTITHSPEAPPPLCPSVTGCPLWEDRMGPQTSLVIFYLKTVTHHYQPPPLLTPQTELPQSPSCAPSAPPLTATSPVWLPYLLTHGGPSNASVSDWKVITMSLSSSGVPQRTTDTIDFSPSFLIDLRVSENRNWKVPLS